MELFSLMGKRVNLINSNKNLEIDYGKPLGEIYNFVRAWSFKDRPRPYFYYNGNKRPLDCNNSPVFATVTFESVNLKRPCVSLQQNSVCWHTFPSRF